MATLEDLEKRIKILEDAGTAAGAGVQFGFHRVERDVAELELRVAELEKQKKSG